MKAPIWFIYGNCIFAEGSDDCWAAFTVELSSYAWLSDEVKRMRLLELVGAIEAIEADIQLLRVSRAHIAKGEDHVNAGQAGSGPWAADGYARQLYEERQQERLEELGCGEPLLFLLVSLREPDRDVASYVSKAIAQHPRELWRGMRAAFSMREKGLLGVAELEQARVRADRAHARLDDYLPVRQSRGVELQWLVRRAFCRGLGEPRIDGLHEPRALVFERNGKAVLAPLEGDVMRWMDSYVEHRGRTLRIESELGTSWQAHLVAGALPERMHFPGARAELMFAAPESLPFGVDLTLNARYLPNELALRIARRRIQDADQIVRAESAGEQGISDLGYERTQEARDLLSYLQASSKPPLLRATLAIAVGASEEGELERRVELCRRAYGEIHLHRPLGDQLQLFLQHLPAQRTRVAGYDDTLTAEQIGAMMPTASHEARDVASISDTPSRARGGPSGSISERARTAIAMRRS